jgi:hypothetical protein
MNIYYDYEELSRDADLTTLVRRIIKKISSSDEIFEIRLHEDGTLELFLEFGQFYITIDGSVYADFFLGTPIKVFKRFSKKLSEFGFSYDVIDDVYKSTDGKYYGEDYFPRYYQIRDLIKEHLGFDDLKFLTHELLSHYKQTLNGLMV